MKFTDTQRLDYLERLGKEHGWPEQDWNTDEEYELAADVSTCTLCGEKLS